MSANYVYWINTVDQIKTGLTLILGAMVVIEIIMSISFSDAYEEDKNKILKNMKKLAGVMLVIMLMIMFIPSKRALIEMKVAEMLTKENYNFAKDEIKGAIDYIFEKIDEVAK